MLKPFITQSVERYGDCATVTIVRITPTQDSFRREVLEQYETLSRGATASAKKSMRKYAA
jgi:hypothetical protein